MRFIKRETMSGLPLGRLTGALSSPLLLIQLTKREKRSLLRWGVAEVTLGIKMSSMEVRLQKKRAPEIVKMMAFL